MTSRVTIALVSFLCIACIGSTYRQEKEIGEVVARIKIGMPLAEVERIAAGAGADRVFRTDLGFPLPGSNIEIEKEKNFCSDKSIRLELQYFRGARAFLSEFDVFVVVDFDSRYVVCAYDVVPIRL